MAGPHKEEDRFLEERKFETSPSIDLGDLIEEAREAISSTKQKYFQKKPTGKLMILQSVIYLIPLLQMITSDLEK